MSDPDTSWWAGQADPLGRRRIADAVLDVHRSHPAGLTDDELAQLMPDHYGPTVGRMRGKLAAEGLIIDGGSKRKTRRNSLAIVWKLAPEAAA